MINIYKIIIINYINNTLSPNIIKEYAKNNNLYISSSEANILYKFIMNNYKDVLNGNEACFSNLKSILRPELYNKVFNLYNYYKSKYF